MTRPETLYWSMLKWNFDVGHVDMMLGHNVEYTGSISRPSKFHLNMLQYSVSGLVMLDAFTYGKDCISTEKKNRLSAMTWPSLPPFFVSRERGRWIMNETACMACHRDLCLHCLPQQCGCSEGQCVASREHYVRGHAHQSVQEVPVVAGEVLCRRGQNFWEMKH